MIIPLIVVCLFGFVACTAVALLGKRRESAMETRIQSFRNRNMYKDDLSLDLDISFMDRVFKPSVASFAQFFSRVLPKSTLARVQSQLTRAGNPMSYNTFLTFWAVLLGMRCPRGLSSSWSRRPGALIPNRLIMLAGALGMGYMGPKVWLKGKVKAKQKVVIKALPDALDLITTCVEAGLGLDAALQRVAEKSEGPLAEELQKMLRDVSMGKLRREAMTEAERARRRRRAVQLHHRDHPGGAARRRHRPGAARAVRPAADEAPAAGGAPGPRGADQDDLPAGAVHLPGLPRRDPWAGSNSNRDDVLGVMRWR